MSTSEQITPISPAINIVANITPSSNVHTVQFHIDDYTHEIQLSHLNQTKIDVNTTNTEQNNQSADNNSNNNTKDEKCMITYLSVILSILLAYFRKFQGQHQQIPSKQPYSEYIFTIIGSFCGIAIPAAIQFSVFESYLGRDDLVMLVGSFGASAVLLYCSIDSPLAQPRNVLGGHICGAFSGVVIRNIIPNVSMHYLWFTCALAVSLGIILQSLTNCIHPPGGATALIAILPSPAIQKLGFLYIVFPVASGIIIMIIIAVIVNNLNPKKTWPKYWY